MHLERRTCRDVEWPGKRKGAALKVEPSHEGVIFQC